MKYIRQRWAAYGRYGVVVLATLTAIVNGASIAGGDYLQPMTAFAVLCGVLLLLNGLPWIVAPAAATAATAVWGWPFLLLLLVAVFDLSARRRTPAAIVCAVIALAGNALTQPTVSLWQSQPYGSALFLLLAVVAGLWMGSRRRLVTALNVQVEHLRSERELREQAARLSERSVIAAEMHDVLAHRLSLIALHAGVLSTRKDLPAQVAERIDLLRTASTEALNDLRDLLGALRSNDPGPLDQPPAPVLQDVTEVIAQARRAGQRVDTVIDGQAELAPAAHRLAVFRLVQEALTNARKHAPAAPVQVHIDYGPPVTDIEVTNSPSPDHAQVVPSGFGLVGLRERVEALGGRLSAGPGNAGTWSVAARIPHRGSEPEASDR